MPPFRSSRARSTPSGDVYRSQGSPACGSISGRTRPDTQIVDGADAGSGGQARVVLPEHLHVHRHQRGVPVFDVDESGDPVLRAACSHSSTARQKRRRRLRRPDTPSSTPWRSESTRCSPPDTPVRRQRGLPLSAGRLMPPALGTSMVTPRDEPSGWRIQHHLVAGHDDGARPTPDARSALAGCRRHPRPPHFRKRRGTSPNDQHFHLACQLVQSSPS